MTAMWGDLLPEPLKRECHSCGRSEHLDEYSLCETCRRDWDDEMTAILNRDKADEDAAATRAYYGA
jgi:hypothetical protein